MKSIKRLFVNLIRLLPKKKRIVDESAIYFGVEKDKPDNRDYPVVGLVFNLQGTKLPEKYQLPINPYEYVKNQGQWNSCASHAICTTVEIAHKIKNTNLQIPLSERFHYYRVRQPDYMGNFPNNAGQTAREMLKVAQEVGLTPERLCPYISTVMNEKPGYWAFGFADLWKIKFYFRILDADGVKRALYANSPIAVGFMVTDSFVNFGGPILTDETNTRGGHEVVIYGYDDINQEFLCINSWGTAYKDRGLMRVPYAYFEKHKIDTWTISV